MRFPERRILYAGSDKDSCISVGMMLSEADEGFGIVAVANADKALRLLACESFDLYIIDCCLDGIGGVGLCRQIRLAVPKTPIMFFVGASHAADCKTAIGAGADVCFSKSNDLDMFTDMVGRLLKG